MAGPEGFGGLPPEVAQPPQETAPERKLVIPEVPKNDPKNEFKSFTKPDLKLVLPPDVPAETAEKLQKMWGSVDMMAAFKHLGMANDPKRAEIENSPEYRAAMSQFVCRELISERINQAIDLKTRYRLSEEVINSEEVRQAALYCAILQMSSRGNITGLKDVMSAFKLPNALLQTPEMRAAAHARLDLIQTRKEAESLEKTFRERLRGAKLEHLVDDWVKKEKPA